MKILHFDKVADLATLMREITTEGDCDVTAVLFYDKAQELIKALLKYDGITMDRIDFCNDNYGYDKEYYVTLGYENELVVEPAFVDGEYQRGGLFYATVDGLFIDGDANSKILKANRDCLKFEIEFEEPEEDDLETLASVVKLIDNLLNG